MRYFATTQLFDLRFADNFLCIWICLKTLQCKFYDYVFNDWFFYWLFILFPAINDWSLKLPLIQEHMKHGWTKTMQVKCLVWGQSTGHHVTTDGLEPATFGVLAKHQLNVPMSHVIRIILKDCPFLSYKIGKRNR